MNTPTYKLKIKVTKDILYETACCSTDLESGKYNDMGEVCAIVVAVRDFFPKAYVNAEEIYPFGLAYPRNPIELPNEAIKFIEEFDTSTERERMKMEEIEFEVLVTDSVIEKINIDEIKPLLQNHPTLSLELQTV